MLSWPSLLLEIASATPPNPREVDPLLRIALMLGLLAIVILGIGGMMLIWLFGRFMRRRLNSYRTMQDR